MKQNLYDHPEFFSMYKSLRDTKITYNDFIEQPAIKRLLPDLRGKKVLDLGCGFGDLANYLVERGADHVTGVDISEKMLASTREHPQIKYIHSAMEDIDFDSSAFDLVVSSLAFHYIQDYPLLIRRITSWLKPGGCLVFSTEHPMVLSSKKQGGWVKDSDNDILHWPVDHYGEEGMREQFWKIDGVIKYHRKISTLVNGLIQNGLSIQEIDEPESSLEGIEKKPNLINEKKRPSFILFKAQK